MDRHGITNVMVPLVVAPMIVALIKILTVVLLIFALTPAVAIWSVVVILTWASLISFLCAIMSCLIILNVALMLEIFHLVFTVQGGHDILGQNFSSISMLTSRILRF